LKELQLCATWNGFWLSGCISQSRWTVSKIILSVSHLYHPSPSESGLVGLSCFVASCLFHSPNFSFWFLRFLTSTQMYYKSDFIEYRECMHPHLDRLLAFDMGDQS